MVKIKIDFAIKQAKLFLLQLEKLQMSQQEKPISYTLRRIPEDVRAIIKQEQDRIKEDLGVNQITFEYVLYRIVRDFKKCQDGELGNITKSGK